MTIKTIRDTSLIAAALAVLNPSIPHANSAGPLTMRPLHGISFDIGSKRAVSYFQPRNGVCKLVLTYAAPAKGNEGISSFEATRVEAAIPGGSSWSYQPADGTALAFACAPGAEAMSVTGVDQVAAAGHPAE